MIRTVLLVAAAVCFAVAVLVATSTVGGDFDAWLAGGLLAGVLAALVVELPARAPAPPVPPAG